MNPLALSLISFQTDKPLRMFAQVARSLPDRPIRLVTATEGGRAGSAGAADRRRPGTRHRAGGVRQADLTACPDGTRRRFQLAAGSSMEMNVPKVEFLTWVTFRSSAPAAES